MRLLIQTKIINRSNSTIPISDGWHFYFDLGVKADELELQLDVSENIEFDQRNVPNGNSTAFIDFVTPTKIGNRQLDCCFGVNAGNRVVTHLKCEKMNLNLKILQDAGLNKYNYIVVYIPPDRRSIAIEPLTSNINSFNNREGLIILQPDEEFVASIGIIPGTMEFN